MDPLLYGVTFRGVTVATGLEQGNQTSFTSVHLPNLSSLEAWHPGLGLGPIVTWVPLMVEHTVNSHTKSKRHWKRLYENTERCISSKNHRKNAAYSHDRRKGTVKTRRIAYAARIHVKTQPCRKPGKKALEKHCIFCN